MHHEAAFHYIPVGNRFKASVFSRLFEPRECFSEVLLLIVDVADCISGRSCIFRNRKFLYITETKKRKIVILVLKIAVGPLEKEFSPLALLQLLRLYKGQLS